jgi:hypothetical protein
MKRRSEGELDGALRGIQRKYRFLRARVRRGTKRDNKDGSEKRGLNLDAKKPRDKVHSYAQRTRHERLNISLASKASSCGLLV